MVDYIGTRSDTQARLVPVCFTSSNTVLKHSPQTNAGLQSLRIPHWIDQSSPAKRKTKTSNRSPQLHSDLLKHSIMKHSNSKCNKRTIAIKKGRQLPSLWLARTSTNLLLCTANLILFLREYMMQNHPNELPSLCTTQTLGKQVSHILISGDIRSPPFISRYTFSYKVIRKGISCCIA